MFGALRPAPRHGPSRGSPGRLAAAVSALPARRRVERRGLVLLSSAAAFAAVFGWRQVSPGSNDQIALLYVVPVALVALELGLAAGIAAGASGLCLLAVWLASADADIGSVGIISRAAAYLTVGAIAGRFADRMRDAQSRQRRLLESGLGLAQLGSGNGLAGTLAAQAQHAVAPARIRVDLSSGESAEVGDARQTGAVEHVPLEVHGARYGLMTVRRGRPLTAEDHATLVILTLQAAVAAENAKLLGSERERAVAQAQLRDARELVAQRGGQLRELMVRHEAERDHVAHELSEDAAQMLAAVLLGLGALERELGSGDVRPRLGNLRAEIDSTLRSLRALAIKLRPPALALGLPAALAELGESARRKGPAEVRFAVEELRGLTPETETMIYRIVEEALDAAGAAHAATIRVASDSDLVVEVQGAPREIEDDELTILRARLDLAGGTLETTASGLRASVPLR